VKIKKPLEDEEEKPVEEKVEEQVDEKKPNILDKVKTTLEIIFNETDTKMD